MIDQFRKAVESDDVEVVRDLMDHMDLQKRSDCFIVDIMFTFACTRNSIKVIEYFLQGGRVDDNTLYENKRKLRRSGYMWGDYRRTARLFTYEWDHQEFSWYNWQDWQNQQDQQDQQDQQNQQNYTINFDEEQSYWPVPEFTGSGNHPFCYDDPTI